MEQVLIEEIVQQVVAVLAQSPVAAEVDRRIPVGVSSRHIHLSAEHLAILFGCGYALARKKDLAQTGQFAAEETVTLVGPKGVLTGIRVLGPLRKETQVELALTDGFRIGLRPPLRDSGDIKGSSGVVVVGPCGAVTLTEGVICATRHIHMDCDDAKFYGVADNDYVTAVIDGPRGACLNRVLVRVRSDFRLEFHIDTDEANAVCLKSGDKVTLSL